MTRPLARPSFARRRCHETRARLASKTRNLNYLIKKGTQKDVMLEPYDIVEVGKAKKPIHQIILEMATGVGLGAVNTLGQGLPNRILY